MGRGEGEDGEEEVQRDIEREIDFFVQLQLQTRSTDLALPRESKGDQSARPESAYCTWRYTRCSESLGEERGKGSQSCLCPELSCYHHLQDAYANPNKSSEPLPQATAPHSVQATRRPWLSLPKPLLKTC